VSWFLDAALVEDGLTGPIHPEMLIDCAAWLGQGTASSAEAFHALPEEIRQQLAARKR
jgi:hypothetical protein